MSRRLRLPAGTAVCAAACVFLLPSSQLFVAWTTNFVPGTLTVLLALVVYRLLDSGVEPLSLRLQLADWRRFLVAQALLLSLLCIYPPSALFFLVPAFADLLFTPLDSWPRTRGRLIRDVAFTAGGMFAYFVLVRLIYLPLATRLWPEIRAALERNHGTQYEFAVTSTPGSFYTTWQISSRSPLPDRCMPSFTSGRRPGRQRSSPRHSWSWPPGVFANCWQPRSIAGAGQRPRPGRHVGEALLAGLVLFCLAAAPVVLARPDDRGNGYRLMFAAAAMGSLLAFWILPRSAAEHRSADFKRFVAALPRPAHALRVFGLLQPATCDRQRGD